MRTFFILTLQHALILQSYESLFYVTILGVIFTKCSQDCGPERFSVVFCDNLNNGVLIALNTVALISEIL